MVKGHTNVEKHGKGHVGGERRKKTRERALGWRDTRKDLGKCQRMGIHGNGHTNSNGEHFRILRDNNTFFPHKLTHRTTLTSPDADTKNYSDATTTRNPCRNQIDYTIMKNFEKSLVEDSRSYEGITSVTNNKIVKIKMSLEWWKLTRKSSTETTSMTQLYGKNTKIIF